MFKTIYIRNKELAIKLWCYKSDFIQSTLKQKYQGTFKDKKYV